MKRKNTAPPTGPRALAELQAENTDPLGSWTGVPADPMDTPVQDADDL